MKTKGLSGDQKAAIAACATDSAAPDGKPDQPEPDNPVKGSGTAQPSPPTEALSSGGATPRRSFQELVKAIGEMNCTVLASAIPPNGPEPHEVEKLAQALHHSSAGMSDDEYERLMGEPRRVWRSSPTAPWDRNRNELCEWERDEFREQARLLLEQFHFRLSALEDQDRMIDALSEIICICAPGADGKYNFEQIAWDVEEWARWGLNPIHEVKPFSAKPEMLKRFRTVAEVDAAYFPNVKKLP